jgi:hypothetical protein
MAGVAAATKSYFVGPQDGWVEIVTGAVTAINYLRVSAYPHTHPFQIAASATKPAATVTGVTVCHKEFTMHDDNLGVAALFWVKVNNPGNQSGRIRIDVYSEGGVLQ